MPVREGRPTLGDIVAGKSPLIQASGNSGRSLNLPPDDILRAILDIRGGDDELAAMMTLVIDAEIDPSSSTATSQDVLVRARLEWGTGGVSHVAVVDVGRGTILSLPTSFLRVAVANEGGVSGSSYVVGASAGYLPRAGPSRGTRTIRRATAVAAGESISFAVPTFATDVTIYRTLTTSAYQLRFSASSTSLAIIGSVDVAANADAPAHLPLPNECRIVSYVDVGSGTAQFRAVFGLAF